MLDGEGREVPAILAVVECYAVVDRHGGILVTDVHTTSCVCVCVRVCVCV